MGSLSIFPLPADIMLSFANRGHLRDTAEGFFLPSSSLWPFRPASPAPGSSMAGHQQYLAASSSPSTSLRWCHGIVPLERQLMNSFPWQPRGQISSKFHQCSNFSAIEWNMATLSPTSSGSRGPCSWAFCLSPRSASYSLYVLFLYSLNSLCFSLANPLLRQSPL